MLWPQQQPPPPPQSSSSRVRGWAERVTYASGGSFARSLLPPAPKHGTTTTGLVGGWGRHARLLCRQKKNCVIQATSGQPLGWPQSLHRRPVVFPRGIIRLFAGAQRGAGGDADHRGSLKVARRIAWTRGTSHEREREFPSSPQQPSGRIIQVVRLEEGGHTAPHTPHAAAAAAADESVAQSGGGVAPPGAAVVSLSVSRSVSFSPVVCAAAAWHASCMLGAVCGWCRGARNRRRRFLYPIIIIIGPGASPDASVTRCPGPGTTARGEDPSSSRGGVVGASRSHWGLHHSDWWSPCWVVASPSRGTVRNQRSLAHPHHNPKEREREGGAVPPSARLETRTKESMEPARHEVQTLFITDRYKPKCVVKATPRGERGRRGEEEVTHQR